MTLAGARCYNQTIGRFLAHDPLSGVAPGWTGYRFAGDDPVNVTDPTGLYEYTDGYGTWDNATVAGSPVTYGNLVRAPGQSGDGIHPKSISGDEVARDLVGRNIRIGFQNGPGDPIYSGGPLPTVLVTASRPLLILKGLFSNRFNSWQPIGTGAGLSVNPLFPQHSAYAEGVSDIVWGAISPVLLGMAGGGEVSVGGGRALVSWFKGLRMPTVAARGSTATARSLGVAGERAVGIGSKTRIPSLTGTAKYRIPDGLSSTTLTEVKNVSSLSYTRQLWDFHMFSQQTGRQFMLYTRPTTTFSGPLQGLINQGQIIVRPIPGF